jgi:hypothetical protein
MSFTFHGLSIHVESSEICQRVIPTCARQFHIEERSLCQGSQTSVFFSRSLSCQTGFFSDENGVHFAIIKFLWTNFLAIHDIF